MRAEVNKPRPLTAEQAATWCGLQYAGRGQIKPGDQNPLPFVGFAIDGPVILLGTPEDNPLIKTEDEVAEPRNRRVEVTVR